MILSVGQSDGSLDKRNGPEEKDAAMTSKKKEEAKKSKRPKIPQKHLEFFGISLRSSVNL